MGTVLWVASAVELFTVLEAKLGDCGELRGGIKPGETCKRRPFGVFDFLDTGGNQSVFYLAEVDHVDMDMKPSVFVLDRFFEEKKGAGKRTDSTGKRGKQPGKNLGFETGFLTDLADCRIRGVFVFLDMTARVEPEAKFAVKDQ